MKIKTGVLVLLFLLCSVVLYGAEWTVMIYLSADNNLEDAGIDDFIEMSNASFSSEVNLLIQFDRIDGYDTRFGDWTECHRFHVAAGMVPKAFAAISNWGDGTGGREVNMGDPNTLADFINWGIANYPANRYAVVVWDHGGGWRKRFVELRELLKDRYSVLSSDEITRIEDEITFLKTSERKNEASPVKAVSWDDSSGGDALETREIRSALEQVSTNIDLFGFDACLMQMLEVAYEIRNECGMTIASEETIPWDGWYYTPFLNDLAAFPTMSSAELATSIIDAYSDYYAGRETLSAVYSAQIGNLATQMSALAQEMTDASDVWSEIQSARSSAPSFTYGEFRDIGGFLQNLINTCTNPEIVSYAQNALNAYQSSIVYNHSGPNNGATGLSIYFSAYGDTPDSDYRSDIIAFAADTFWDDFLAAFSDYYDPVPSDAVTLYSEDFEGGLPSDWNIIDGYNDQLTWEVRSHLGAPIDYYQGQYMFVDSDAAGIRVDMDEALVSSTIDCSGYPSVYLRFGHTFTYYTGEIGDVDVRAGSGSWQNIVRFQGSDDSGVRAYDISSIAAGEDSVQVRWHYYDANYDWYWGVDNVEILGANANAPGVTYDFESDNESWESGGAAEMFTLPIYDWSSGSLSIQSVDSSTYGYWEGLHDAVSYIPDSIYRATFTLRGSALPELAPSLRIRINTQSSTVIGTLVVASWVDGAEAPGEVARDYTLYFDPLDQSGYQSNEALDDLFVSFDLLNFNPDNDPTGAFYVDNVVVDRFDTSAISAITVKTYDLIDDFSAWEFAGAPGTFTLPISAIGDGSLTLTSDNNANDTYGFWESSRVTNELDIAGGLLYRALFTVSSKSAQIDCAQLQLRLGTESNQMTSAYLIYSNIDGTNSPPSQGARYPVYLYPPQSDVTGDIDKNGLVFAMDMLNFYGVDDPHGNLTLEKVEVQTIDPATLP